MEGNDKVELKRGLRGVYIDRTESSYIDGKAGKLLYRGYDINDLATDSTFEEVCYLLLYGSLPTVLQLQEFDSGLKTERQLPEEILRIIGLTSQAHPMDALRTAVSALSAFDPEVSDTSVDGVRRKGARLIAKAPAIVAAHARIRDGKPPVAADNSLGHAANFLYMLLGKRPAPEDAKLLDKDLLLHAEHGVNASTFAARVAASTEADFYAAITAAIAVLKGPLHGGAAEAVMKTAQEIGSEENAESYVTGLLERGERVMGFGHAVYKTVDPRSLHLKADAKALGERKGRPGWFSILQAVAETDAMKRRARRGLHPNVDFWSGAIYYLLEIPDDLFIPVFALGRIPGWTAHLIEQYMNNILMRPLLEYVGPKDRAYRPIGERT